MNDITRQIRQATEALPFNVNHRRFEAEPAPGQCLRTFLRGPQHIVVCLARGLDPFQLPTEWQPKFDRKELLVVSPFDSSVRCRATFENLSLLASCQRSSIPSPTGEAWNSETSVAVRASNQPRSANDH